MIANDIYSIPIFDNNKPNFNFCLRKKRVKKSTFWYVESIDNDNAEDDESILSDYLTEDDDSDESLTQSDEGSSNNDEFLNDFEDYFHLTFDFSNISKLPKEDRFMWIIIWIMKFRSNYNLLNTATEDLIKFIRLLQM